MDLLFVIMCILYVYPFVFYCVCEYFYCYMIALKQCGKVEDIDMATLIYCFNVCRGKY